MLVSNHRINTSLDGLYEVGEAIAVDLTEAVIRFDSMKNARTILLAISGGPDSLALLYLAKQWQSYLQENNQHTPEIHVACVDHELRPEAADEAAMVAKLARGFGLPSHTLQWHGEKPYGGLAAAARQARYQLLFECAHTIGASHLLTAHHSDDAAETVLMRLVAGSGITGLAGIAASSQRNGLTLMRPLLGVSKARLLATCIEADLPWAVDPGNLDATKGRGRIRALEPLLAEYGLDNTRLLRLGQRAARADEALNVMANMAFENLVTIKNDSSATFDMSEFTRQPEEIMIRIITRLLKIINQKGDDQVLYLGRIENLTTKIAMDFEPNKKMSATLADVIFRVNEKGICTASKAPPRRS